VYHTEKQIVTRIYLSHSGFVFAIAKIGKISGFTLKKSPKNETFDLTPDPSPQWRGE